ncbi:MAG TPA: PEP-CTERM sorting domain-containing protein [Candidatus Binatia bacterium]|nr:PEP-CTERM sorting domain-containing protein [Candidatus Binatia bacterium]
MSPRARGSPWSLHPVATVLAGAFASLLAIASSAAASTTFGSLSNFDVFNDTGQECHGFEIELDGVTSADVSYTFGAPYERYGNPKIVDFPGGVFVRYESPYDPVQQAFTQATPMAPAVITPTDGHACWTGGSGSYLTSGCEHFGLGLNANPTSTVYRWLIADPSRPGSLLAAGTSVSLPAPVWNVVPQPAAPPVVQAVVPAPPPEIEGQFGDAMWVKVFVTEAADPVELDHLVTDDPAVPQEAGETEIEWTVLQAGPAGGGARNEIASEAQVGAGNDSVTRRYEFYEYTGAYDTESHEVTCGGDGSCDVPLAGELGNYLGAQNAAVNLAELPACAIKPAKPALLRPWRAREVPGRHPRLSWSSARCADDYTVVVRLGSKTGPIADRSPAQTSTTYKTSRLERGMTYFWKAKACNGVGCTSSAFSHFTVPTLP